jgi:superfamily II DNA or RNA helicase
MSNNFITNNKEQKTLKSRLNTLISVSEELKFLVGYFYFSGWEDICDGLRQNPQQKLKLLVGLQVCSYLGKIIEYGDYEEVPVSRDETFRQYLVSLGFSLNNDTMDTEDFYNQVRFFLEMIATDRLIIRKTENPNHAKLYLFQLDEDQSLKQGMNGQFITGSSNLTRPGLHGQEEFNVEIRDYGYDQASAYFDDLWERAVPITEVEQNRTALIRFVESRTQVAAVTPFEAYCLIMKTYLDLHSQYGDIDLDGLLERVGLRKLSYQSDAVGQALRMIGEHNGCIIADVVGLGKSVIASMIARQLNLRGIIICPPGLIGDPAKRDSGWWEYLEKFGLYNWQVYSRGIVDRIADDIAGRDFEVVIVDEAHYFRNQDTADYEALWSICRGKKVVLLSATPFNNSPMDIYALLNLFIVPGKSTITLEDNVARKFVSFNYRYKNLANLSKNWNSSDEEKKRKAEFIYTNVLQEQLPVDPVRIKEHTQKLSNEIKRTISPVVIRRNRLDLKEDIVYSKEIGTLSTVGEPKELFYFLSGEQDKFYDEIIRYYFAENGRFTGAIYQPYIYKNRMEHTALDLESNREFNQQRNLYEFMRRLLVKRFESSFGSFGQSIERFLESHRMVLDFIQKTGRFIPDRSLINKIRNYDMEDIDANLARYAEENLHDASGRNRVYVIDQFERKDDFLADIASDIAVFETILAQLRSLRLVDNDPKQAEIIRVVKDQLEKDPSRKIILFSEYVDTIKHLEIGFRKEFGNSVLVCDGKVTREMEKKLNGDFNAQYGGSHTDHFKILLTSDKLSEGYNLNRAGIIINYDIPWNPTRVIQRVGRINRIGVRVFDELYIYNFFPSLKGADIVRSREIAQQKMFLIHHALGEDARIFDADEQPTASSLRFRINQYPEEDGELSAITRIRNLYAQIGRDYPEVIEKIETLPSRVKTAKSHSAYSLSVLRKKGLSLFAQVVDDGEPRTIREIDFEELLGLAACNFDEPVLKLSSVFWPLYEEVKQFQPRYNASRSEISLESKAIGNLKHALKDKSGRIAPHFAFIRMLINDLNHYYTLPTASIRRIAGKELKKDDNDSVNGFLEEILWLKKRLGEDYLELLDGKLSTTSKEVIISIENISSPDLFQTNG